MDQATHNKIVSFIWGIADDVLRDLFKRGKYPDVILPLCVTRRMDAVLEPTKKQVLETKAMLDKACLAPQITRGEVESLAQGIVAWHKALAPAGDTTCVFRDSAFADDVAKTNLAAILHQHGLATVRSL